MQPKVEVIGTEVDPAREIATVVVTEGATANVAVTERVVVVTAERVDR